MRTTGASVRSPERAAARSVGRGTGRVSTPNTGARATATGTAGTADGSTTAGSSNAAARPSAVTVARRAERLGLGATRPSATRTVAVDTPVAAAIFANDKPRPSSSTICARRAGVNLVGPFGPVRSVANPSTPAAA